MLLADTFLNFNVFSFKGNDQEAVKLLSSGDVRVDCLDEVGLKKNCWKY